MGMIKGTKITLYEMTEAGVDDFGAPIYEENAVEVDNILIEPVSNDAIVSELQLTGKKLVYMLHIPRNDEHNWKDSKVEFYGEKWRTFGDCLIWDKSPLIWNKKIKVERYE